MKIDEYGNYKALFVSLFKAHSLIPIIGSGISGGVHTPYGKVPTGTIYKEYMLNEIIKNVALSETEMEDLRKASFSEIAAMYEDDSIVPDNVRKQYYKNNFYGATYSNTDIRRKVFDIDWPYIYSLNIDDAIESSTKYKRVILPEKEFYEERCSEENCVLKLHGDIYEIITYKKANRVFTSKEYATSLRSNRPMLNKLQSDYENVNIVFIGTSLDDELDLMSLETINVSRDSTADDSRIEKRNIILVTEKPSLIKQTKYRQFGITDIVVFDNYDLMPAFLFDAWKESLNVDETELDIYANYKIDKFNARNRNNLEYYHMALNPVSVADSTITVPYYSIRRTIVDNILNILDTYPIQIVTGQMFSGKSYLITLVFDMIRDRKVFLFDSTTKISDQALVELLKMDNIVALFDSDSLQNKQIRNIIDGVETIRAHKNSILLVLNSYDTETTGLFKIKENDGYISGKDYFIHQEELKNYFNKEELNTINSKLPQIGLVPMRRNETIVNHLMRSTNDNSINKYSNLDIPCKTVKEIALSIALASYGSLTYGQVVKMEFTDIIGNISNECAPLIERTKTSSIERNGKDMSQYKYVLNSKYWMRNGLNSIAHDERKIVDAYRYLIERLTDYSSTNLNRRRSIYKKIVYFDTINDIFGKKRFGNRSLVAKIYEELEDLLANDYQYNHQRAKCLMINAYYRRDSKNRKEGYEEALKSAQIAKGQVENEVEKTRNKELLMISLAHIEYTIASIMASLCQIEGFKNENMVYETLKLCNIAISNIRNEDDFERDRTRNYKYGIIHFIKTVSTSTSICRRKEIKKECEVLLNKIIKT